MDMKLVKIVFVFLFRLITFKKQIIHVKIVIHEIYRLWLVCNRKKTEMVRTPMIPLHMPRKLRFNITPEIKKDIEKAKQNMNMWALFIMLFHSWKKNKT